MFNVEFDLALNVWCFDFHGDIVVLDARDKDHAIEERDRFLMEFGIDVDNEMES